MVRLKNNARAIGYGPGAIARRESWRNSKITDKCPKGKGKMNDITDRELFCQAATSFNGLLPYEWGGQGFMGVDCSGVIVLSFQQTGKMTSSQDYTSRGLGSKFPEVEECTRGCLALFCKGNGSGGINHVAIVLQGGKEPICFEAGGGGSQDKRKRGESFDEYRTRQVEAKKTARILPLRAILGRGKGLVKYVDPFDAEGRYVG